MRQRDLKINNFVSRSHPSLITLSNDQLVAELVWTMRVIKEVIGVTPTMMRPPCEINSIRSLQNCLILRLQKLDGEINDRVRSVIKALGLEIVIWNRDTNDWTFSNASPTATGARSPIQIINRFTEWVAAPKMGTISLQVKV
jgi:peptidoglycan/xylan/chitin deacetylase (PgdA/CDA1 family)